MLKNKVGWPLARTNRVKGDFWHLGGMTPLPPLNLYCRVSFSDKLLHTINHELITDFPQPFVIIAVIQSCVLQLDIRYDQTVKVASGGFH